MTINSNNPYNDSAENPAEDTTVRTMQPARRVKFHSMASCLTMLLKWNNYMEMQRSRTMPSPDRQIQIVYMVVSRQFSKAILRLVTAFHFPEIIYVSKFEKVTGQNEVF